MPIMIGISDIKLEDLVVNDDNKEMLQTACEFWELGMLEILFKKRILTEEEYSGIVQIIKKDYLTNV